MHRNANFMPDLHITPNDGVPISRLVVAGRCPYCEAFFHLGAISKLQPGAISDMKTVKCPHCLETSRLENGCL